MQFDLILTYYCQVVTPPCDDYHSREGRTDRRQYQNGGTAVCRLTSATWP